MVGHAHLEAQGRHQSWGVGRLVGSSVQDPQEVADAVFRAATEANASFGYIVGRKAQGVIPAYRNQDFEPFAGGMLTMPGLSDWVQAQRAA
jgi:Xaa-Pro aminopeptidase